MSATDCRCHRTTLTSSTCTCACTITTNVDLSDHLDYSPPYCPYRRHRHYRRNTFFYHLRTLSLLLFLIAIQRLSSLVVVQTRTLPRRPNLNSINQRSGVALTEDPTSGAASFADLDQTQIKRVLHLNDSLIFSLKNFPGTLFLKKDGEQTLHVVPTSLHTSFEQKSFSETADLSGKSVSMVTAPECKDCVNEIISLNICITINGNKTVCIKEEPSEKFTQKIALKKNTKKPKKSKTTKKHKKSKTKKPKKPKESNKHKTKVCTSRPGYESKRHTTKKHVTKKHVTKKHVTKKHVTKKHVTKKHATKKRATKKRATKRAKKTTPHVRTVNRTEIIVEPVERTKIVFRPVERTTVVVKPVERTKIVLPTPEPTRIVIQPVYRTSIFVRPVYKTSFIDKTIYKTKIVERTVLATEDAKPTTPEPTKPKLKELKPTTPKPTHLPFVDPIQIPTRRLVDCNQYAPHRKRRRRRRRQIQKLNDKKPSPKKGLSVGLLGDGTRNRKRDSPDEIMPEMPQTLLPIDFDYSSDSTTTTSSSNEQESKRQNKLQNLISQADIGEKKQDSDIFDSRKFESQQQQPDQQLSLDNPIPNNRPPEQQSFDNPIPNNLPQFSGVDIGEQSYSEYPQYESEDNDDDINADADFNDIRKHYDVPQTTIFNEIITENRYYYSEQQQPLTFDEPFTAQQQQQMPNYDETFTQEPFNDVEEDNSFPEEDDEEEEDKVNEDNEDMIQTENEPSSIPPSPSLPPSGVQQYPIHFYTYAIGLQHYSTNKRNLDKPGQTKIPVVVRYRKMKIVCPGNSTKAQHSFGEAIKMGLDCFDIYDSSGSLSDDPSNNRKLVNGNTTTQEPPIGSWRLMDYNELRGNEENLQTIVHVLEMNHLMYIVKDINMTNVTNTATPSVRKRRQLKSPSANKQAMPIAATNETTSSVWKYPGETSGGFVQGKHVVMVHKQKSKVRMFAIDKLKTNVHHRMSKPDKVVEQRSLMGPHFNKRSMHRLVKLNRDQRSNEIQQRRRKFKKPKRRPKRPRKKPKKPKKPVPHKASTHKVKKVQKAAPAAENQHQKRSGGGGGGKGSNLWKVFVIIHGVLGAVILLFIIYLCIYCFCIKKKVGIGGGAGDGEGGQGEKDNKNEDPDKDKDKDKEKDKDKDKDKDKEKDKDKDKDKGDSSTPAPKTEKAKSPSQKSAKPASPKSASTSSAPPPPPSQSQKPKEASSQHQHPTTTEPKKEQSDCHSIMTNHKKSSEKPNKSSDTKKNNNSNKPDDSKTMKRVPSTKAAKYLDAKSVHGKSKQATTNEPSNSTKVPKSTNKSNNSNPNKTIHKTVNKTVNNKSQKPPPSGKSTSIHPHRKSTLCRIPKNKHLKSCQKVKSTISGSKQHPQPIKTKSSTGKLPSKSKVKDHSKSSSTSSKISPSKRQSSSKTSKSSKSSSSSQQKSTKPPKNRFFASTISDGKGSSVSNGGHARPLLPAASSISNSSNKSSASHKSTALPAPSSSLHHPNSSKISNASTMTALPAASSVHSTPSKSSHVTAKFNKGKLFLPRLSRRKQVGGGDSKINKSTSAKPPPPPTTQKFNKSEMKTTVIKEMEVEIKVGGQDIKIKIPCPDNMQTMTATATPLPPN